MNRKDIIDTLLDFAGPLGPFRSFEDEENARKLWHNSLDLSSIDILTDIILNPPEEKELAPVTTVFFESEIIEALTSVGRKNKTDFLKEAENLIHLEKARPIVIDVIGSLRSEKGIELLEQILQKQILSDDEVIRLASSFSEIGGVKSQKVLKQMKLFYSDRSQKVLNELESALSDLSKNELRGL